LIKEPAELERFVTGLGLKTAPLIVVEVDDDSNSEHLWPLASSSSTTVGDVLGFLFNDPAELERLVTGLALTTAAFMAVVAQVVDEGTFKAFNASEEEATNAVASSADFRDRYLADVQVDEDDAEASSSDRYLATAAFVLDVVVVVVGVVVVVVAVVVVRVRYDESRSSTAAEAAAKAMAALVEFLDRYFPRWVPGELSRLGRRGLVVVAAVAAVVVVVEAVVSVDDEGPEVLLCGGGGAVSGSSSCSCCCGGGCGSDFCRCRCC
jgi:hypothetical protein